MWNLYHNSPSFNGKKYGKYYSILGRLYTFDPELDKLELKYALSTFDKAMKNFNLAIQYEDEKDEDYFKRCSEHLQYLNKCELRRLRLVTNAQQNRLEREIRKITEWQNKLRIDQDVRNAQIEEHLQNQSAKMVETAGIFTAVIVIILGGVNIAGQYSVQEGALLIFMYSCLCYAMTGIPSLTFYEDKKKKHQEF